MLTFAYFHYWYHDSTKVNKHLKCAYVIHGWPSKESVEKTPSNVMTSLVDKLRNDISEKEKKIRAMGRIIADLKTELVDNAVARERKDNVDSGNMLDLDEARRRIEDLTDQNENLNKQIEVLKSKQVLNFH